MKSNKLIKETIQINFELYEKKFLVPYMFFVLKKPRKVGSYVIVQLSFTIVSSYRTKNILSFCSLKLRTLYKSSTLNEYQSLN